MTNKVDRVYNSFWKDIVEKNGKLDKKQVKKEISDYKFLLDEVPIVYHEITGCLSKTNYTADTILSLHREKFYKIDDVKDDILYIIEKCDGESKEKLIKSIEEYFGVFRIKSKNQNGKKEIC